MPFRHLLIQVAPGTVDFAAALYCRTLPDLFSPAQHVSIGVGLEELRSLIHLVSRYSAVPGPDGHVGNTVFFPRHIAMLRQLPVEHIQLTFGFHGVAVDRVFEFLRRIGVKMTEAASKQRSATHLPDQPIEAFRSATNILRDKGA